jgi:hypothetical protein
MAAKASAKVEFCLPFNSNVGSLLRVQLTRSMHAQPDVSLRRSLSQCDAAAPYCATEVVNVFLSCRPAPSHEPLNAAIPTAHSLLHVKDALNTSDGVVQQDSHALDVATRPTLLLSELSGDEVHSCFPYLKLGDVQLCFTPPHLSCHFGACQLRLPGGMRAQTIEPSKAFCGYLAVELHVECAFYQPPKILGCWCSSAWHGCDAV